MEGGMITLVGAMETMREGVDERRSRTEYNCPMRRKESEGLQGEKRKHTSRKSN
jgi:hypothetical protein